MKKKKIVAAADTHGQFDIKFPKGDILIVAGDVTYTAPNDFYGQRKQIAQAINMVNDQAHKYELVILTFGNHETYKKYKMFTINSILPENFANNVVIVEDYQVIEHDGLNILVSPYSPKIWPEDPWGFHEEVGKLDEFIKINKITDSIDIIVSHAPPYGIADKVADSGEYAGSKDVLKMINTLKPQLLICGHIHEGMGTYKYKDTIVKNVSLIDEKYQMYTEKDTYHDEYVIHEMEIEYEE